MDTVQINSSEISLDDYGTGQVNVLLSATMQELHDMGIKGCPMGRGATMEAAVADLIRRIEQESAVTVKFV